MLLNAQPFMVNDDSDDKSTLLRKAFVVDTTEWYDKENPRKHQRDDKGFHSLFSCFVILESLCHNILFYRKAYV